MAYVDAFVAAVPTANRDAFRAHALVWAEAFRRHGALRVCECWGEEVPDGELTSFPMAVKKAEEETVVVSWIEWPDKPTRDAAFSALMEDDAMKPHMDMPFDGKRMVMGGFDLIVSV